MVFSNKETILDESYSFIGNQVLIYSFLFVDMSYPVFSEAASVMDSETRNQVPPYFWELACIFD